MLDTATEALEVLLIRWWQWCAPIEPSHGYEDTAPGFGMWRASCQYDDGALLDELIDHGQMVRVDREIGRLEPWQHRQAINILAESLVLGTDVLADPRLPKDRTEAEQRLELARVALTKRLMLAGVL